MNSPQEKQERHARSWVQQLLQSNALPAWRPQVGKVAGGGERNCRDSLEVSSVAISVTILSSVGYRNKFSSLVSSVPPKSMVSSSENCSPLFPGHSYQKFVFLLTSKAVFGALGPLKSKEICWMYMPKYTRKSQIWPFLEDSGCLSGHQTN